MFSNKMYDWFQVDKNKKTISIINRYLALISIEYNFGERLKQCKNPKKAGQ